MRDRRFTLTVLSALVLVAGAAGGAPFAVLLAQPPGAQNARPAPPRDPGRPGGAIPAGKGSITGSIAIAGAGQPARRARVVLSFSSSSESGSGGGSQTMTTDDNGTFTFSALPAGRFSLMASKPGYISGSYGQKRPGRSGTPIQLGDGQRIQVQLQIWRGGVITGTLVDENAEAVPGTPVRALRYVMQSGVRTLQNAGNSQTDDRGVYRIYGLQPGDYLVFATPRNTNQQGGEAARQAEMQALMQRAELMARNEQTQAEAQSLMERVAQLRNAAGDASDEPATGYAPVYYPGTTAPASAATIALAAGEEKSGIDFQYQVVPISRIDGIVTSAGSQMPQNVQITLVNNGFSAPGIGPGGARADAQGSFRIANVPPGQYTVVARGTIGGPGREGGPGGRGFGPGRGNPPAVDGRGPGGPGTQTATRYWATADVTVDGRNVANVMLTLQSGMNVAGHVAFNGTTQQAPTDLTRFRVTLIPVITPGTSPELASAANGTVDSDGRFTISSVVPGRYRMTASTGGTTGWYVGSAVVDGQDSLDFPIEVKPGQAITNAVVTFVDRQSELTGMIVNDRAEPVLDYSLIVYPADQRYWTPQARRIQSTRPATDGRYSFRNLPAGDYRVAPVMDPEPGSWFDPAFLQQLDSAAVHVTIADGEKKEQNLRVPGGA
jgi:hypothetical protein